MSIKFQDVSFTYSPKTPFSYEALRNIDLEILEGTFSALVGRTGCGKSTLIQHINALLIPNQGTVYIDEFCNAADKKKRDKKTKPLREKVGLIFQFPEYQLFEETVEKDVAFGPKNFGSSKEEALEKAHAALLEVGLDSSFFTRSPFELSGGEKRRVAIAGVLAMKPKYLIADEPTAGLDPVGAREIMDLLTKVHEEGTTVILVTHDMDLVLRYCSDVIVLDHGKVVKQCKPDGLFEENVERYSLASPLLYSFARRLEKKGFAIDPSKLKTPEDLAEMIQQGRKKQ